MNFFSQSRITDEQAMWRVQMSADGEAFALLVQRWQRPIQSLCTRMLGDLHRGEDLTQEAFARVFSRRKAYAATGKFSTFLWRVALNLCYDDLRRRDRRRETAMIDEAGEAIEPAAIDAFSPDLALSQRETAERVRSALLRMSETYRSVLVLRHYEGLKFREIAEVLEIPEGTVKSRMAEGLAQMARLLEGDDATTPLTENGQRPAAAPRTSGGTAANTNQLLTL